MTGSNNQFVFVVCGSREHINTLHYALKALQHFSSNDIVVLTDSTRNEIPIDWPNVVDVRTPEHFNHHQASVYLKTGIHRFLETGHNYCYLDTDVIALNTNVDNIFNHFTAPITFAPDHCTMKVFSPYSVHCGCLEQNKKELAELEELQKTFDKTLLITDPIALQKQKKLMHQFQVMRTNKLGYLLISLRFLLSPKVFKLNDDTFYNRWKKYWFDAEGRPILYDSGPVIKKIEKTSQWRWHPIRKTWMSPTGGDVYHLQCGHLREAIKNKFNIEIPVADWQHWNGGVFLFNSQSHEFLDAWHRKTMEIFTDPYWRTRDQGTLIATAWEFGLGNHPMLSKQFNFIADYFNPRLMISDDRQQLTDDAFVHHYEPAFIHIYHHFGSKGWEIWDWMEQRLASELPDGVPELP